MIGAYLFAIASVVLSVVFSWFRSDKPSIYSLTLKISSSVCFILCGTLALKATGSSNISLLIIVGLVLGLIGDILLDLKVMYPKQSNEYFITGTFSFAMGHFFYFLAVVVYNCSALPENLMWNVISALIIAMALTATIMLSSKKMGLNFGSNFWIAVMYCFILTFMVAFSVAIAIFSPIFWIFAVGMILFLLSDLVLSMQYFGGRKETYLIYVNHILYYIAQVLIALSILYIIK